MLRYATHDAFPGLTGLLQSRAMEARFAPARPLAETGVLVMICGCVLAPNLYFGPPWPEVRLELLLLILYAAVYFWLLMAGIARTLRFHALYLIAALSSVSVVISMAYGTVALRHPLLSRDFYELPKAWMPAVFFLVAYEAELSERALERLLDWMAWVCGIVCFYGIAQYFDLGFTFRLNRYYSGAEHHEVALALYHRVYSTLGSPNVLAQFLCWMMLAYALAWVFRVGSRVRNLGVALACVVTLVLTGSRYGLVSSALGLILLAGLALATRRRGAGLIVVALVALAFGAVMVNARLGAKLPASRFEELQHPLEAQSIRARFDNLWLVAGEYIASSPWVGHGPAKQLFGESYTDSEYLDVMKQYGLFGLLAYLAYYLWPLVRYAGVFRIAGGLPPQVRAAVAANLLLVAIGWEMIWTALAMNVGEFTFYNWYLLGFFWLWIGLSVRAADFIRELAASSRASSGVARVPLLAYVPR